MFHGLFVSEKCFDSQSHHFWRYLGHVHKLIELTP